MSNFTEAEIQDAVAQFVRGDIKTQRDQLGPLDVDQTFSEVREFVSSTLLFDPNAIFYLIFLATNRVNQDVTLVLDVVDDLKTAIQEVGRFTTIVEQTSLLEDAAAALLEVDRLLIANNAITQRPFSRYITALDTFTDASLTPNMSRSTGQAFPNVREIVRPPPQARTAIRDRITELRTLHTDTIAEAAQLVDVLSEFLAAGLPAIAIQSSVRQVRNDLDALKAEFDGATDEDAIGLTRDAFLRIKAGKSVITNLTSVTDPRDPRMEGLSTNSQRAQVTFVAGVSDADSAEITSEISAPWQIIPSVQDQVIIAVDEGSDQTATVIPPEPAFLQSALPGPFDIHSAQAANLTSSLTGPYTVPASPDNVFEIFVDGVLASVTLTSGSRTAAQIASEIIAAGIGVTASDVGGVLKITHNTVGKGNLLIGTQSTLNTALGFTDSQDSDSSSTTRGVDANDGLAFIVDHVTNVIVSLTAGTVRTTAQVAADIAAASSLNAVDDSGFLKVSSLVFGEGSHIKADPQTTVQEAAFETLGLPATGEARSEDVSISAMRTALAQITGIETEESLSTVASGVNGTAVLDGSDYKLRLPSGTLSVSDPPTIKDKLSVLAGDNSGFYAITNVSLGGAFDELTVGRAFPVVTGDQALIQSWEIRRDLLIIRSANSDLSSSLNVKIANANTEIGLTVAETRGKTPSVIVKDAGRDQNFLRRDVREGDILAFLGATVFSTHTITQLTEGDYQIEVDPKIDNNVVGQLFRISSAAATAYDDFADDLNTWINSTLALSKFKDNLLDLERRLNPLLTNKRPSDALINDAFVSAESLNTLYVSLQNVLVGFTVDPVTRIDAVLDMLRERGLERAHDLLLLGELTEFFALTKETASYSGNLLEKSRDIAQNDVPVGTGDEEDHIDMRLISSHEDEDPDFDFSDRDEEFDTTEVDDVPDPDDDEDILNSAL